MRAALILPLGFAALCFGCDGSDGPLAAEDSGTPHPSFEARDECSADDDCDSLHPRCVDFEGGQSACRVGPQTPLACADGGTADCCANADCGDGQCVAVTTSPVMCSATAGFDTNNRCLTDDCVSDDDCASDHACTPDGFGDKRECIPAACHTDADCTAEPGGACVVLHGGCCQVAVGGGPSRPARLACAYPSDGCQADSDCDEGRWCGTRQSPGRAQCSSDC